MKQLLSIILILATVIPDSILAMKPSPSAPPLHSLIHYPNLDPNPAVSSGSSSPVFPEYPDPFIGEPFEEIKSLAEINPVRINRYSNPLRSETIAHIEKCSRGSGLIGAILGGCTTGSYVQKYYSNLSPIEKIGITGAGSALSGALAYVTAKWITTNRTAEKRDEALANDIIDLNNTAFTTRCNLDTKERSNLNYLITQDQYTPKNRTVVYHYALTLHPSKQAREYPIGDAVNYLDGTADKIKQEGEALGKMKTERPLTNNGTISDEDWNKILKDVRQTHKAMSQLNGILPAGSIRNWTDVAKQLPEYTYQNLQKQLRADHKNLKDREAEIRYNLARLAALHGHTFSQVYLSKTFANHLWASLSTNYSNTPEGRRARAVDIEQSKNNISSSMQTYLTKANIYSQQVITHNNVVAEVPGAIKLFVKDNGGNIDSLNGYTLNQNLLEYNRYLNHNDGNAIWTWLQSCFSE